MFLVPFHGSVADNGFLKLLTLGSGKPAGSLSRPAPAVADVPLRAFARRGRARQDARKNARTVQSTKCTYASRRGQATGFSLYHDQRLLRRRWIPLWAAGLLPLRA